MKTTKLILSAAAFVFAIGGAFATQFNSLLGVSSNAVVDVQLYTATVANGCTATTCGNYAGQPTCNQYFQQGCIVRSTNTLQHKP